MEEIFKDSIFWIVIIAVIIGSCAIYWLTYKEYVERYGECPKVKFYFKVHTLDLISYKTGYYRDSGFSFPYKYCNEYKCRKCGKIIKE